MQRNLQYIGRLTIKSIRDYILDNSISEEDTILLNPFDFDELTLEYRRDYNEGMPNPYFLMRVLLKEDASYSIPQGRIQIISKDTNRFHGDYAVTKETGPDKSHQYDNIYRCGWCGNFVDFDGAEFDDETRSFKIAIREKFSSTIIERSVNGRCCRHKY